MILINACQFKRSLVCFVLTRQVSSSTTLQGCQLNSNKGLFNYITGMKKLIPELSWGKAESVNGKRNIFLSKSPGNNVNKGEKFGKLQIKMYHEAMLDSCSYVIGQCLRSRKNIANRISSRILPRTWSNADFRRLNSIVRKNALYCIIILQENVPKCK